MSSHQPQMVLNLCTDADGAMRGQIDSAILARARYLSKQDQHLLHLALTGRNSYRQIAALVMSNPGSVCRRVNSLTRRLGHPIVAMLADAPMGLCDEYQRVGLRRFLCGESLRSIAQEMQISESQVRAIVNFLPRWFKSALDSKKGEVDVGEECSAGV